MFLTDIQPVRARKTDPATSHAAAKNAERFADYLQRVAVRKKNLTIAKSEPGRIPNALRSTPQGGK